MSYSNADNLAYNITSKIPESQLSSLNKDLINKLYDELDAGYTLDNEMVMLDRLKKVMGGEVASETKTASAEVNYAKQLIDSKRVTFDDAHVSGVKDQATSLKNIKDAAEGKAVQRSNYGNAPGGEVIISDKTLKALISLSKTYTFNISELAGASHSVNSKHYFGAGVDITKINGERVTINNVVYKEFMEAAIKLGATKAIGPPTKYHGTHVHLQF